MDDVTLQKLANIAAVKNHINNVLGVGRGVIPKPKLHKIQQVGGQLDAMFVDLLLEFSDAVAESDIEDISKRVMEEKAKLAAKKATVVKAVSVETPVEPEPETKRDVKKNATKKAAKKSNAQAPAE